MNILRLSTFLIITIMLVPTGVSAHCEGKHTGDHPHCSKTPKPGGKGEGTYSAVIGGVIAGGSGTELWLGGQKGVGLDSLGPTTANITFDYFRALFTTSPIFGTNCFGPSPNVVFLNSVSVNKGKKGRAQATLWFEGLTGEGVTSVLYAFELTGKFDGGDNALVPWPPEEDLQVKTMTMDTWLLHVEAEGDVIKSASCIDGSHGDPVEFPASDEITIAIQRHNE